METHEDLRTLYQLGVAAAEARTAELRELLEHERQHAHTLARQLAELQQRHGELQQQLLAAHSRPLTGPPVLPTAAPVPRDRDSVEVAVNYLQLRVGRSARFLNAAYQAALERRHGLQQGDEPRFADDRPAELARWARDVPARATFLEAWVALDAQPPRRAAPLDRE